MQIPSPNAGRQPQMYRGKEALYFESSHPQEIVEYEPVSKWNPLAGVKAVSKVAIIPDNPEIIDTRTGESNSKYWQPEKVLDPEGCDHDFVITNVGKREAECSKCKLPTNFHIGSAFREEDGKYFLTYHEAEYPLSL